MITWTDSARAVLESHNQRVRQDLVASGADPDEVAADLQRHIEEELTAAKIRVATRDEVERVLGRMGVNATAGSEVPRKRRRGVAVAAGAIVIAAGVGAVGYVYLRPVHHDSYAYPPQWLVPTSQDPAKLTLPINLSTHTPDWGRFQGGDSIIVTSVKGDRPDFEVGGRYLIEGRYTLASAEASGLSVSVTAKRGGVGAISPGHPEEGILAGRGEGSFRLIATMRYPGTFHVSFNPLQGGESRGTVYFTQAELPDTRTLAAIEAKESLVIHIADDGSIALNGETLQEDQLLKTLERVHADRPNAVVSIEAKEGTEVGKLQLVMESCKAAGLNHFNLQAR